MTLRSFLLLLLTSFLLSPLACSSDGLIGGECIDGYAFCDGACISVSDDETNCGACNVACTRNLACVVGLCGGPDGDITLPDPTGGAGGMGGIGSGGISVGAGGPGGVGGTGGATGGGSATGGTGGSVCFPPYDSPEHCGDCDTRCTGTTPNCAPDGMSGFECVANCLVDPFTTECSGQCIDPKTDAAHCGGCNNLCPSGICVDSNCIGATSGHMVALCSNYRSQSPAQSNLLANTVFLAGTNPVRIMGYTRDTPEVLRTGLNYGLSQAAILKGRSYELTEVTAVDAVNDDLNRQDYDVLLVYDQEEAPAGLMSSLAVNWLTTVNNFTRTGGIVIVVAGGGGTDEMTDLISGLNIFGATGTLDRDGSRFYVKSPGDAVGINVISPFLGVTRTCAFQTLDVPAGDLVFVTSDEEATIGNPHTVHRIVVP